MGIHLNPFSEQEPSKKFETKLATVILLVKQINRVNDLRLGHLDIDDAEISSQTVADKPAAEVEQDPEALIGNFERDETVVACAWVEIPGEDARVLVQVVNDGLADLDPVVDACEAFVFALAADNRHTAEGVEIGPDDFSNAVRLHFYFGLFGKDEFRVEGDDCVGTGTLRVGVKDAVGVFFSVRSLVESVC